ncbi:18110_t:CDS:2 [Funneliformis geosporum]|nr:18110_t:CDS:2 [Funneliformis geosporum]
MLDKYNVQWNIKSYWSEINDPKLEDEIRQLHLKINDLKLQITRKDISLVDAENKFTIKSEEMQAL